MLTATPFFSPARRLFLRRRKKRRRVCEVRNFAYFCNSNTPKKEHQSRLSVAKWVAKNFRTAIFLRGNRLKINNKILSLPSTHRTGEPRTKQSAINQQLTAFYHPRIHFPATKPEEDKGSCPERRLLATIGRQAHPSNLPSRKTNACRKARQTDNIHSLQTDRAPTQSTRKRQLSPH